MEAITKAVPMISIEIKSEKLKSQKRPTDITKAPSEVRLIIETVGKESGIPVIEMLKMSRKREIVTARHMAMYFIKEHTDYTLKKIGSFFSNRDHSTVINANTSISDLLDTDKKFKQQFNKMSAIVANEVYIHNICGQIPAKIF